MLSSTKVLSRQDNVAAMPKRSPRPAPRQSLIRNLRYLMKREKLSEESLAKKAGVAQKTVNKILNGLSAPTLDTLDRIAGAFGLTSWHLIIPNLPDELISSPSIERLYKSYSEASEESCQGVV